MTTHIVYWKECPWKQYVESEQTAKWTESAHAQLYDHTTDTMTKLQ